VTLRALRSRGEVERRYNKALNPVPSPEQTVLPASCCPAGHQGECLGGGDTVHTGDCFALSLRYLQQHAATLGAAAIAVTCLMVGCSLFLSWTIKSVSRVGTGVGGRLLPLPQENHSSRPQFPTPGSECGAQGWT
jgi:hypothetical protein